MINPIKELETFANKMLEKSKKVQAISSSEEEEEFPESHEDEVEDKEGKSSELYKKELIEDDEEDNDKSDYALKKSLSVISREFEENLSVLAKSQQAMLEMTEASQAFQTELQTKIEGIEKSMENKLEEIYTRLEDVLSKPLAQKSFQNVQAVQKNFNKSLNGVNSDANFSKSQALNMLTQELYKGNPLVSVADIIGIESGAPLRPQIQTLLQNASNI